MKIFMARTQAPVVTTDPVAVAVTPSASSPSVSPSRLAEAVTWTTSRAWRAGRRSFTRTPCRAAAAEASDGGSKSAY